MFAARELLSFEAGELRATNGLPYVSRVRCHHDSDDRAAQPFRAPCARVVGVGWARELAAVLDAHAVGRGARGGARLVRVGLGSGLGLGLGLRLGLGLGLGLGSGLGLGLGLGLGARG